MTRRCGLCDGAARRGWDSRRWICRRRRGLCHGRRRGWRKGRRWQRGSWCRGGLRGSQGRGLACRWCRRADASGHGCGRGQGEGRQNRPERGRSRERGGGRHGALRKRPKDGVSRSTRRQAGRGVVILEGGGQNLWAGSRAVDQPAHPEEDRHDQGAGSAENEEPGDDASHGDTPAQRETSLDGTRLGDVLCDLPSEFVRAEPLAGG